MNRPCKQEVELKIKEWNETPKYYDSDKAIYELIAKFPDNTDVHSVYIKCQMINGAESSRLYNKYIYDIAKNITKVNNINERIKAGDLSVVKDIAECGIEKKIYSFATKYCSAHNKTAFPKKDSLVAGRLRELNGDFHFTDKPTNVSSLGNYKNYRDYVAVIDDFRRFFALEEYTYKEIDEYLWLSVTDGE